MNLSQNTCIRKQKFSGFGGIKRTTFFRVQNEHVMTKNRTDPNSFYYQQTHKGANYRLKDYWQPGDVLSDSDHELLMPVQLFYQQNRYPPSQKDMDFDLVKILKDRFRTWKNVLIAAELPALNDPDVQKIRQKEMQKRNDTD